MGLPIDPVTQDQAIARVMGGVAAGRGGVVATPNLDHLRQYTEDPDVRELYERADLSLADGMPLVWACRLQGTPVPGRVAGSDLSVSLSEAAAGQGASIFLLGGAPGIAEDAARTLRAWYPGIDICGHHCPPFGFERSELEMARVEAELARTEPDIVYLALSFPRSLRIAVELSRRFPRTWFLGIGISLSFISGDVRRAPLWVRRAGLEWAHRLAQEPRRLARRYLKDGVPFGVRVMLSAARARRAARPAPARLPRR
jgi:N-acetylglucosaminyldiphosphoundecaprenol N-acetyl-beta-D-mannosaminyltransferase